MDPSMIPTASCTTGQPTPFTATDVCSNNCWSIVSIVLGDFKVYSIYLVVNPRRVCARVTVVVLCVCVCQSTALIC